MFSPLAQTVFKQKYSLNGTETWPETAARVVHNVMAAIGFNPEDSICKELVQLITDRKFMPAGRYLYAAGREVHQTQNCVCLGCEDSREGWSDLLYKASMSLMTGAGIGVDYSKVRCEGSVIKKTGGVASGPLSLMSMVNECARHIQQGGSRRSAVYGSLLWSHPDVNKFIHIKNWSAQVKAGKAKDYNFPAPLDMTNISVRLDQDFFDGYCRGDGPTKSLYRDVVHQMCRTGEPGFSVNLGEYDADIYTNACSEYRSPFPDNICNLGSANMARISSLEEFSKVIELGSIFLYAGTHYSTVPYEAIADVRADTRQIGLGLMGIHEWLIQRGHRYGETSQELKDWLNVYAKNKEAVTPYCKDGVIPYRSRAIAPNGTTGILAETSTGIEPIFCTAYKRRYLKGNSWHYQYVVDPVAKRLLDSGIPEQMIEDAYSIEPERRIAFQAFVQEYVDMAISSTVNLPAWGSEWNNEKTVVGFGDTLMKYLPRLRGITTYPDASRAGQPLTTVSLKTALKHQGQELTEEQADVCDIRGGSCGG